MQSSSKMKESYTIVHKIGNFLINGIENFWSQAKRHLRKFNGIPKAHFELYLKECEWRFNYSNIKIQISYLKQLVKGSLL